MLFAIGLHGVIGEVLGLAGHTSRPKMATKRKAKMIDSGNNQRSEKPVKLEAIGTGYDSDDSLAN